MGEKQSLDMLCVNTIRTLSIDAIQKANSGHPGLPLGAAPMAYALWKNHLKQDPSQPSWPDRDRFILSAGHGSMLIYSLLHLFGFSLSMDDIKDFRQWGSLTPGHPEYRHVPGVEATTGPLGQGTANAVGMAIAERALANRFNRPDHEIVDHFSFALVSDGDLMEGISTEAASLAGQLGLGKLIYLYDANDVTLDGPADLTFSVEDVGKRYEAYGWQVLHVKQGDTDLDALNDAISQAKADTKRPSIIIVKTTIGYGSPNKQGTASCHGSPLGVDEVALTKQTLGWDAQQSFMVPDDAKRHVEETIQTGKAANEQWQKKLEAYAKAYPELHAEFLQTLAGELPQGWDQALPVFEVGEKLATRVSSGKCLNAIAQNYPALVGGDADLSCSTKTALTSMGSFDGQSGAGRNIHFGVREHAMAAIANGMAYHGGVRPFTGTFFVFSDYMRPSIRLAAMNGLPVLYVFTHDSFHVGEDGPTHQPVEHLMSWRAMPKLTVLRPCDANETAEAWKVAVQQTNGPAMLVFSRQGLPTLDRSVFAPASNLARGAYVLRDADGAAPQAIIIATGSEVHIALQAQEQLAAEGIGVRVVSMPSWELFEQQDEAYKESVLPSAITARVSVEAGATFGWERYIGLKGVAVGMDRYGASAPGGVLQEKFGFTGENVAGAVKKALAG